MFSGELDGRYSTLQTRVGITTADRYEFLGQLIKRRAHRQVKKKVLVPFFSSLHPLVVWCWLNNFIDKLTVMIRDRRT